MILVFMTYDSYQMMQFERLSYHKKRACNNVPI